MNIPRPPANLVDRFTGDLAALGGVSARLALAVSGGPDSMALLLLAAAALPGRIVAATVDHGLRPEAAGEAEAVAALCARLDCPHEILRVEVPDGGEGLQASARTARYGALTAWCAGHRIPRLATAHHADDQAETLLMRLQRGAGVAGLAGIRALRREGGLTIVRPLLGWRKAELETIVAEAGVEAADDASNRNPRFDRARIRAALAALPELDALAIARSAAALQDAEQALAWASDRFWSERVGSNGAALSLNVAGLPAELRRRLATRILATLAPQAELRGEAVTRLVAALERGEAATLAGIMARPGERWSFAPAPARRSVRQTQLST